MFPALPSPTRAARAIRAWRARRGQRIQERIQRDRRRPVDASTAADPIYRRWCVDGLPPVDRKAVPNRRHRKVVKA